MPHPRSRSGSTWLVSCVLWEEFASNSAAPPVLPPTVRPWARQQNASTPWSPWAPATCPTLWCRPPLSHLPPPTRPPSAAFWTGCCLCWCAATIGSASTSALMWRTCWAWSSALPSTPCCSTNWGTALEGSLTRRDRYVKLVASFGIGRGCYTDNLVDTK